MRLSIADPSGIDPIYNVYRAPQPEQAKLLKPEVDSIIHPEYCPVTVTLDVISGEYSMMGQTITIDDSSSKDYYVSTASSITISGNVGFTPAAELWTSNPPLSFNMITNEEDYYKFFGVDPPASKTDIPCKGYILNAPILTSCESKEMMSSSVHLKPLTYDQECPALFVESFKKKIYNTLGIKQEELDIYVFPETHANYINTTVKITSKDINKNGDKYEGISS